MTEAELRHRASEARRLLDEPLLREALDDLEHAAIEELLSVQGAQPEDDRTRRMLADRVKIIRRLRGALELTIAEGRLAADSQAWAA